MLAIGFPKKGILIKEWWRQDNSISKHNKITGSTQNENHSFMRWAFYMYKLSFAQLLKRKKGGKKP